MNCLQTLTMLMLLAAFLVVSGAGCGSGQSAFDITPCNPNATDAAKTVLAYLGDLTLDKASGIISGQNCGHGNEIAVGSYNSFFEALHTQTGQYPGMIGIDYEYMREFSIDELKAANTVLKDHWNHGGWVTINWSPDNPWGTSNNLDDIRTKYPGTDLNLLITPGSPVYAKWMEKLDRIATALQDLRDAGVVVLWRPMQEMNGSWFWWGKVNIGPEKHDAYIAVWRHMYNYFTNEKGLNNLLWVFSPNVSQSFSSFPYPGNDVVDVIGGTEYSNTVSLSGYQDYLAYNKPVGIAECGPSEFEDLVINGTFDDRLYASSFRNNYPAVAYWVTWHSWPGVKMAIVDNQNASSLMNNSYLINRGARP